MHIIEFGSPSIRHVWLHSTTDACASAQDDGELDEAKSDKEGWVQAGVRMIYAFHSHP